MADRVVLVLGEDWLGTLNNLLQRGLGSEDIVVLGRQNTSLAWVLLNGSEEVDISDLVRKG